jgi:hypothetical protein
MNTKQIRAMRRYAHALHTDLETAARRWRQMGLAAQWRLYETE